MKLETGVCRSYIKKKAMWTLSSGKHLSYGIEQRTS